MSAMGHSATSVRRSGMSAVRVTPDIRVSKRGKYASVTRAGQSLGAPPACEITFGCLHSALDFCPRRRLTQRPEISRTKKGVGRGQRPNILLAPKFCLAP